MRWMFFLLLAANLVFGVFAYLREKAPSPDAQIPRLQMNADQVRIVQPPETPAPASAATPEHPACVEWGTFGAAEIARAQTALDQLAFGERARRIAISVSAGYWVHIPPLASKTDMDRKAGELQKLGVTDYFPMLEPVRWRYAISLGVFRSEDGAKRYLAQLRQKGVRSAIIGEREQRVTQTAFIISEPTETESAKLVELRDEFPDSGLRAVECPK